MNRPKRRTPTWLVTTYKHLRLPNDGEELARTVLMPAKDTAKQAPNCNTT